ncbi:MAG: 23S rRNA (guanosine(2251)-2'-O)-methyltransferase RlmB [Salinivirgaceae bacterium]|jgi:23S rRNA (guanosine2251-2'-O)-methyltransferase|nr:23S rRNA (guanosine(2251)-2'-O)-methyltransferase RlmB [Salinivirgaceae bacterium]
MEQKNDFIFGIRAVEEALKSGQHCDKILLRKGMGGDTIGGIKELMRIHKIPLQEVPDAKLNRITGKNHQGIIALMSPIPFHQAEDVLMNVYDSGKDPFFLLLDEVTDIRNFGAIVRTAECAGVHGIIIPQKGSARIGGDAVKTSSGALFNIPICKTNNMKKTLSYLKDSGLKTVAATEKAEKHYFKCDMSGPVVLIMGAEDVGISKNILEMVDVQAALPINGKIESLNVSNAAAVMMYEIVRQRSE